MQQPPQNYNELLAAINPVIRQLDRLEERTRNIVTRADLESLRKELVAHESLEPQLNSLKMQITHVEKDCEKDKKELDERLDKMEKEQVTRQDRLWMKLGPAVGVAAFALALFEFLSHLRFLP